MLIQDLKTEPVESVADHQFASMIEEGIFVGIAQEKVFANTT